MESSLRVGVSRLVMFRSFPATGDKTGVLGMGDENLIAMIPGKIMCFCKLFFFVFIFVWRSSARMMELERLYNNC